MIFLQPISIALFLLASAFARPLDAIDTASGQSVSVSERGRGGEGGIDQLGSAGWLGWLSGLGFGDVQVTLLNPRTTEQDTFPSRSSSFTPRISAFRPPSDADEEVDPSTAAFQGLLRPITSFQFSANASSHPINMHGCPSSSSEELSPDGEKHGTANFALALRGECSFAVKVKTAVRLGAKALIVGDDVEYPGETDEDGRKRTTLLTMYAPTAGDPSSYNIPAIFVSRSTYLTLRDELVKSPVGIQILLTQEEGWEWPLMDFLFLLLLLPSILTLSTLALHHIRLAAKRRKDRAPVSLVESLQTRVWGADGWEKDSSSESGSSPAPSVHSSPSRPSSPSYFPKSRPIARVVDDSRHEGQGEASTSYTRAAPLLEATTEPVADDAVEPLGPNLPQKKKAKSAKAKKPWVSTSEECCICLSDFEPGQIVTILPCGHLFHKDEIVSWLTGFQKLCPVCKHDISQPRPLGPPCKPTAPVVIVDGEGSVPTAATESTPLLRD